MIAANCRPPPLRPSIIEHFSLLQRHCCHSYMHNRWTGRKHPPQSMSPWITSLIHNPPDNQLWPGHSLRFLNLLLSGVPWSCTNFHDTLAPFSCDHSLTWERTKNNLYWSETPTSYHCNVYHIHQLTSILLKPLPIPKTTDCIIGPREHVHWHLRPTGASNSMERPLVGTMLWSSACNLLPPMFLSSDKSNQLCTYNDSLAGVIPADCMFSLQWLKPSSFYCLPPELTTLWPYRRKNSSCLSAMIFLRLSDLPTTVVHRSPLLPLPDVVQ